MGVFKRFTAVALLICILFSVCSCGINSGDALIYFSLSDMPDTLDAQTAQSDSELMLVRNIYEGLMRENEKGEIVKGVCEDYEFSNLTYTFTLRQGLKWSNGEPLTASDFAFGIKRALLPETKSHFARLLYSIKGARGVHAGSLSADSLGISAKDDKTLIIKLEYDDPYFLSTLSRSVSMPCNEKFFYESLGKYGLEKEYVISCGSYRLSRWNKVDNGIRLYKNDNYNGNFKAKNGGVFIGKDKEKSVDEKLKSGESDMAFLSSDLLDKTVQENIKTVSVGNILWVLSLGGELNENIRRALCLCYKGAENLPSGFSYADCFYPAVLGSPYTEAKTHSDYSPDTARQIISEEIKQFKNKKFPQTTLTYSDNDSIRPVITEIVGEWQKNLSTFINIKATDKPLQSELVSHSLSLCAFPVKADSTAGEYIRNFLPDGDYVMPATLNTLSGSNSLLPIAFENTNIGYLDNLSGVYMSKNNGYIDFSYIVKE